MVFGSQEFFSGRLPVQEKWKNFRLIATLCRNFVLFTEVCMVRINLEKLA